MNEKKILNRLIHIFILLNIILLISNISKNIAAYWLPQERLTNIRDLLSSQGIEVQAELPKYFAPREQATLSNVVEVNTTIGRDRLIKAIFGESLEFVTIKTVSNENKYVTPSRVYSNSDEQLSFDQDLVKYNHLDIKTQGQAIDLVKAKKVCKAFIKRIKYDKIFRNAYIEVKTNSEGYELTYYPKFNGLPVFSSYMIFTLRGNDIEEVVMRLGEVTYSNLNQEQKEIYPIDLVLFGMKDYLEIEKDMIITSIILGYDTVQDTSKTIFGEQLVPIYKIETNCLDEPLFVNAYTNKRIQ